MPVYRLRLNVGETRTVTAGRVILGDDAVLFQSPVGSSWTTVAAEVLSAVHRVERRFNEADGRVRWADEDLVNQAALAARPPMAAPELVENHSRVATPMAGTEALATAPTGRAVMHAPPVVSAGDVRCPQCEEQEDLSGRRVDGGIVLTCHACGYDGPRIAQRRCSTCGGTDVVERPKALVERARGTQLSVVGYTTIGLCRLCDAGDLAAALEHGGAVMPKELPTVDPQTLQQMGKGAPAGTGTPGTAST